MEESELIKSNKILMFDTMNRAKNRILNGSLLAAVTPNTAYAFYVRVEKVSCIHGCCLSAFCAEFFLKKLSKCTFHVKKSMS